MAVREKIAVDGTVLGEVSLDDVPLVKTIVLARGQPAEALKRKVGIVLNFGMAAELLGIMHAAAGKTLDYLRLRVQFLPPIGSFQALQHRAVDDHVRVETVRSLIYEAAKLTQFDANLEAHACAAKAKAADAAPVVIASGIQMHARSGFTDEHDIGLLLKRALTLAATYGPGPVQRRRYAVLQDGRGDAALPNIRNPDLIGAAFPPGRRGGSRRRCPPTCETTDTAAVRARHWWHRELFIRGWIAPVGRKSLGEWTRRCSISSF